MLKSLTRIHSSESLTAVCLALSLFQRSLIGHSHLTLAHAKPLVLQEEPSEYKKLAPCLVCNTLSWVTQNLHSNSQCKTSSKQHVSKQQAPCFMWSTLSWVTQEVRRKNQWKTSSKQHVSKQHAPCLMCSMLSLGNSKTAQKEPVQNKQCAARCPE